MRVDYHLHTRFAYDSSMSLEDVLERAARTGIGRVCVTDHDPIEGALVLRAMSPLDVKIVIGCEFSADDGSQVIGLGLA